MRKAINYRQTVILLAFAFLIGGCQSKMEFRRTKEGNTQSLTSLELIRSYNLRFNPKANGAMIIKLESGTEYTAERLNASQVSSLLVLVQSGEVQFDTENEEFVLKGGSHD